jgi:multidrug resistance efflux pump
MSALPGICVALVPPAAGRADEPKAPERGEVVRQPGHVVPARTVRVSARVGGVLVDVGDQVKAGQVLARLDRAEAELGLKRAEAAFEGVHAKKAEAEAQVARRRAEVAEAEAAVKAAAAQREFRKHQVERFRDLFKSHSIDQRLVDETEQSCLAAEAQVRQAEAHLATVQAQAEAEKVRLVAVRADLMAAEVRRELAKLRLGATDTESC